METFIDTFLPFKITSKHSKDKSWITPDFKSEIMQRQSDLRSGNFKEYTRLRNKINHESKEIRKTFFKEKMQHVNENDPKQWWRHIKDVVGLSKQNNAKGDIVDLAADINCFFHSVSVDLPPLPAGNRYSVTDLPALCYMKYTYRLMV